MNMKIAILGGTGDIGEALALRLANDTTHEIVIGSRKVNKATESASDYEELLEEQGTDATISGAKNPDAVENATVVIAAVPAFHLSDTIESVTSGLDNSVLISPAVGMERDEDGLHYNPPSAGSVTALAEDASPEDVPVIGAFHNLAAGRLGNLDKALDWDVPVIGDENEAKATVINLITEIEGLRPLDAGGINNASEVEAITPLLINIAVNNSGMHDLGIKFN